MLEYSIRLVHRGLGSILRSPVGPLGPSTIRMRVWPTDVDVYGHMNNGRYLTMMDFGRTDLVIRSGMGRDWLRRGWRPILGGATISYRRSLTPLRRYELVSHMACWDDKWFYIEQRFERRGELYATALAKGLVTSDGDKVHPQEMMESLCGEVESPPMPPSIARWRETEAAMRGY